MFFWVLVCFVRLGIEGAGIRVVFIYLDGFESKFEFYGSIFGVVGDGSLELVFVIGSVVVCSMFFFFTLVFLGGFGAA